MTVIQAVALLLEYTDLQENYGFTGKPHHWPGWARELHYARQEARQWLNQQRQPETVDRLDILGSTFNASDLYLVD